ncbi:MAG: hypothetical protein RI967_2456 [Planctomycetota bacterium]
MELILVRHARAFDRDSAAWPDDARRPLTVEGRDEFARLARRLARVRPRVDLVESSGFVRAWQTAQILSEKARWPKPSRLERLEPGEVGGGAGDVDGDAAGDTVQLEALRRTASALAGIGCAVWVGHEPLLSRLASLLLTGAPDALSIRFKKGAALAIRLEPVEGGTPRGSLAWMLVPAVAARKRPSRGKRGGRG